MVDTVENLILDLVEWAGRKERTYQETMEAWRTSCPQLPVWEDATERGFVATTFVNGVSVVKVTETGFAFLREKRPHYYKQLRRPTDDRNAHQHHKPTEQSLRDFAREWTAAWNSHDLERILEHYADNVELVSPFVAQLTGQSDGCVRGKSALGEYFARGLNAFPTLRFDFIRLYTGVRSCVLEYHSINGLRTAELMEFDAHGKVHRVLAHYSEDATGLG